jgi:predicted ArsR family transcriptional regulator
LVHFTPSWPSTELVCGMNLAIVEGMLGGLPRLRLAAMLDPAEGRCCVRLAADQRAVS